MAVNMARVKDRFQGLWRNNQKAYSLFLLIKDRRTIT